MSLAQMTPVQLETRRQHWQRRAAAADARYDRLREERFGAALASFLRARLFDDAQERVDDEMRRRGLAVSA